MSAKKYYWLKLKDDFFTQPKIKKLRKIAGGDTYTVIYLKMQLLSLKNEGILMYEGTEDNFIDEIALCIDEEPENVSVTVNYLLRQGLLEQVSETDFLLHQTVQNIGSESSSAERVRRFRERNKTPELGTGSEQTEQKALQCNADVTECNTEKKREKREREKREDIEIETEREETVAELPTPPRQSIPYEAIREAYNETCTSFPKCTKMSDGRKRTIKAKFASGYTLDDFKTVFSKAEASGFLRGRNDRNWTASFDWLIKDQNMAKVLDGNYDDFRPDLPPMQPQKSSNPFFQMLREEEARNGQK